MRKKLQNWKANYRENARFDIPARHAVCNNCTHDSSSGECKSGTAEILLCNNNRATSFSESSGPACD